MLCLVVLNLVVVVGVLWWWWVLHWWVFVVFMGEDQVGLWWRSWQIGGGFLWRDGLFWHEFLWRRGLGGGFCLVWVKWVVVWRLLSGVVEINVELWWLWKICMELCVWLYCWVR